MTPNTLPQPYQHHDTVAPLPDHLAAAVRELVASSKRPNTVRAYLSDLQAFSAWCRDHDRPALPATADTVAAYLADNLNRLKLSTLRRHLSSISKAHEIAGHANPVRSSLVADTVAGAANTHGAEPDRAPGLTPAQLVAVLAAIDTSETVHGWRYHYEPGQLVTQVPHEYERPLAAGIRDRALLLVGWCSALRRSELAALTWRQVKQQPNGDMVLTLHGSKTDKTGTGQLAPLAAEPAHPDLCPVAALLAWRTVCEQHGRVIEPDQPVFRQIDRHRHLLPNGLSPHSVGQIITQRSAAAGLSGITGHSLRRGLIQAAHLAGVEDSTVMQTSRHRSVTMLRTYQDTAGLTERAASRGLLTNLR